MRDPVSQGVGLSGTRAGDDEERRTRCGVFFTHTMLDSSSLFAVEAFKISNGHWWQIGQRRSRYSTTILVLFANGLVTQAWPLKVSALPGATHNRIGSNRYRHRSAGANIGPPGVTPVAVKRDARVSWFSLIADRETLWGGRREMATSSLRFFDGVPDAPAKRPEQISRR